MRKISKWLKRNYMLIVAFILFFVLIILLTREGATAADNFIQKIIERIKEFF